MIPSDGIGDKIGHRLHISASVDVRPFSAAAGLCAAGKIWLYIPLTLAH